MKAPSLRSHRLLIVLTLAALGLRVGFLLTRTAVIENEGAGYAVQAEHVLDGTAFPPPSSEHHPDLVDCWFYPLVIALVTLVTRNTELATRIVSLLSGTSLVLSSYFLAVRLYDRRTAKMAATLFAVFPLLIAFSVSGYSEALYISILMPALYWSTRCLEPDAKKPWLWAGILFGCGFLTRTEALVLPFLVVLLMVVSVWLKRISFSQAWRFSVKLVLVFGLFVAPYALLFKIYTGHFALEGKNRLNYTIGLRVLSGMKPGEAARGVDQNLESVGPQLDDWRYLRYSPYPMGLPDLGHYFLRMAWHNKDSLYYELLPSLPFGSLMVWLLAFLGLFAEGWDARRLLGELLLMIVLAYIFVVLLAAHMQMTRYELPILPFALFWAARGIVVFGEWATRTAASLPRPSWLSATRLGIAVAAVPVLWVLTSAAVGLGYVSELEEARPKHIPLKEAGLWLSQQPAKSRVILADNNIVTFYAKGNLILYPYCDSATALRYIRKKNPDFIIVDYLGIGHSPYLEDWLNNGIPDPQAEEIYQGGNSTAGKIRIFSWKKKYVIGSTNDARRARARPIFRII
jgi:4-amino-4-deoxy-L-arabinose transferase-like glycosyltransferase